MLIWRLLVLKYMNFQKKDINLNTTDGGPSFHDKNQIQRNFNEI